MPEYREEYYPDYSSRVWTIPETEPLPPFDVELENAAIRFRTILEDNKKKYTAIQFRNSREESYLIIHWIRYNSWTMGLPYETVCGIKLSPGAYDGGKARYARTDEPHESCKSCETIRNREAEIDAAWDVTKGE